MSAVELQKARLNSGGFGLDADVVWRTADLRIANQQWSRQTFEIADLRRLARIYGRTIDGVVGQDVLRTFASVVINYRGGCVMLER